MEEELVCEIKEKGIGFNSTTRKILHEFTSGDGKTVLEFEQPVHLSKNEN